MNSFIERPRPCIIEFPFEQIPTGDTAYYDFLSKYCFAPKATPAIPNERVLSVSDHGMKLQAMGVGPCISVGFVGIGVGKLSHSSELENVKRDANVVIEALGRNVRKATYMFLAGGYQDEGVDHPYYRSKMDLWQSLRDKLEIVSVQNPNIPLIVVPVRRYDESVSIGLDAALGEIDLYRDSRRWA